MPTPISANDLTLTLKEIEKRHHLFRWGFRRLPLPVVVGVSGGADSLCLLHLLHTLAEEWRLQLHVAHLDHAVRPESAQDAAFVAEVAHSWQLPFHARRLEPGEIGATHPNLEAALRQLRYGFLADVAEEVSRETDLRACLAVAHTREDQTETLLMHICRGSGLDGLAGMQHISLIHTASDAGPLHLLRPLLTVSRTDILQYLNDHRIAWREDPTNRDLTLTRNRLRHHILPQLRDLYPELDTALGNLGEIMAGESERAGSADSSAFHRIWQNKPAFPQLMTSPQPMTSPQFVLDRNAWRFMDLASRRGVLRHGLKMLELPPEEITFARLEELRLALESGQTFRRRDVAGHIQCSVAGKRFSLHPASAFAFPPETPIVDDESLGQQERIVLAPEDMLSLGQWRLTCREIEPAQLPDDWQNNGDRWQAWLDADQVTGLALAPPRPGMRFAPLGLDGHHKLLGDFFTDRRIDPNLRPVWPLLVDTASDEIVWVCGLRLAHPVRVQAHTTRILHLQWSKE